MGQNMIWTRGFFDSTENDVRNVDASINTSNSDRSIAFLEIITRWELAKRSRGSLGNLGKSDRSGNGSSDGSVGFGSSCHDRGMGVLGKMLRIDKNGRRQGVYD